MADGPAMFVVFRDEVETVEEELEVKEEGIDE
jgi:hypothetical protein